MLPTVTIGLIRPQIKKENAMNSTRHASCVWERSTSNRAHLQLGIFKCASFRTQRCIGKSERLRARDFFLIYIKGMGATCA